MTRHVVCDFETESGADLKKVGAWRYAEDPTTSILCLSFEFEDEVVTWTPGNVGIGTYLIELLEDPEVTFVRHADFERAIWRRIMVPLFGFADIPDDRWHDTQAVCAMKGLPLDLDTSSRVLGVAAGKDMEGNKLIKQWSRFDRHGNYQVPHTPANLQRIITYCEQDVRVERGLLNIVRGFQPGERDVWLLDQKINERGVRLDLNYIAKAQKIVDDAIPPLAAEFSRITGGLTFTQAVAVREWCKQQGTYLPDLRKETIVKVIGHDIDGSDDGSSDDGSAGDNSDVSEQVRRALEIRHLIGSASIKKLARMRDCVGADGRARGLLQYHGAGPGRWAGRIVQPQNFPRPTLRLDDKPFPPELIIAAIQTGDYRYVQEVIGPPVETVVSGLRHALTAAPGHVFISGDYATIECRIVLALAGQRDKLALFSAADRGEKNADGSKIDVYCDMASKIFKRSISKDKDPEQRQFGKNSVLGCGFQMGPKTFRIKYAKEHDLSFCKEIIDAYREEWAPEVPKVWHELELAAIQAVWNPGQRHEACGIAYEMEGRWLTARLLSGRKLYYFNATPCRKEMPWSTAERQDIRPAWRYQAIKQGHLKWIDAFGGHLTENVVQGLARDLLCFSMFLIEKEDIPLVLTVHDEELGEPTIAKADEKLYAQIMRERPPWAAEIELPVNVETWTGERYRK